MMTKTAYATLWGALFILCAGLGFIPAPEGLLKWLLVLIALAFFLPPFLMARLAAREGDRNTLALLRNLAALSLVLTVAALIANFFSILAPEGVGNALYILLVILSAPMVCMQYWAISLFLWACLLFTCISKGKK